MSDALAPDSAPCACSTCRSYCERNPGWPTPSEAALLLEAGFADRLMLDHWEADSDLPRTEVLSPASEDFGGVRAPGTMWMVLTGLELGCGLARGRCVLLRDGGCSIYGQPGRPTECRAARHDVKNPGLRLRIAGAWNTDEGRALVERWKALVRFAEVDGV